MFLNSSFGFGFTTCSIFPVMLHSRRKTFSCFWNCLIFSEQHSDSTDHLTYTLSRSPSQVSVVLSNKWPGIKIYWLQLLFLPPGSSTQRFTWRFIQDKISCPCIDANKHSWALCPLTINFLFCFIRAVRLAEHSLALLHWNHACFFSFVTLLFFLF